MSMSLFPVGEDGDEDGPLPLPDGVPEDSPGAKVWRDLTGADGWEFDAASLITVEQLCRSVNLEARLQAAVDASAKLRCRGSRDNFVEVPELGSLVRVRAQTAALQARLRLSEDVDDAADDPFGTVRSESSRKASMAARVRWDRGRGLA